MPIGVEREAGDLGCRQIAVVLLRCFVGWRTLRTAALADSGSWQHHAAAPPVACAASRLNIVSASSRKTGFLVFHSSAKRWRK